MEIKQLTLKEQESLKKFELSLQLNLAQLHKKTKSF